MPIPDFQAVMLPLLRALVDARDTTMRDLTDRLAREFGLTDAERAAMNLNGTQAVFYNRVAWAKLHLKDAGLVERPTRGRVQITEAGRRTVATEHAAIGVSYLKRFPSYRDAATKSKPGPEPGPASIAPAPPASAPADDERRTPAEQIEDAYRDLARATAGEVLDRLKSCSPAFFERAMVRLLMAMGYGGVAGEGDVTGRSGDGGIDGVIRQDKLGLEIVCIQAKRWEGAVGRPVVQQFVGSMDGHRSRKGVIVTTSTFTKDAADFVWRIEGKRVILIDGPRLADLMVEHDLGVTTARTYTLKEVSNDFFEDEVG